MCEGRNFKREFFCSLLKDCVEISPGIQFYSTFPAKAVRLAWCYLCGAIQRSTWMEMGTFFVFKAPVLRTEHYLCFLPNNTSNVATHSYMLLRLREKPSVLFAPQGFYCEHGRSDSCLQTCVSAGYVVSNNQPLESRWLATAVQFHGTQQ